MATLGHRVLRGARWASVLAIAAAVSGCPSRSEHSTSSRDGPVASNPAPSRDGSSARGRTTGGAGAASVAPDAAPRRRHQLGADVTFVVVSDTHLGHADLAAQSRVLVRKLNELEGRAYPARVGGSVARPRGLLVTGDLTEWGKADEWEAFVATFGRDGTEGALRYPVFEVIGNHDKVHGPWVETQVAKRHGGRFYSWDWDDLHLIALGEAPDDEGLAFLAGDLARVEEDLPVVLFFHRALEGPWSTGSWFDGGYKERLHATIARHDVVAIFHGHHHATAHYRWRGIDVWKPGAVKDGAHTVAVVHLTDARFTVSSFDWEAGRWASTFVKERAKR